MGRAPANESQWGAILYLGVVASGFGFFLWNKGAARTSPGTLAAFNNAVVPLAMACSLFVFGEIDDISKESLLRLGIGSSLILMALILSRKTSSSTSS